MTMGKEGEEEKPTGGTATATTTATETTTTASATTSVASTSASTVSEAMSRSSTTVTASSVAQTSSATATSTTNSTESLQVVSMATVLENVTSRVCSSSYPALAAQPPTSTPAAPGSGSREDLPERGVRGQGLNPPEEGRQRAHPGRGEQRARAEAKRVSRARSPQATATSPSRSPPATSATASSAAAASLPPAVSYSPLAASTPIPVSLSPPLASSTPLLSALPSPYHSRLPFAVPASLLASLSPHEKEFLYQRLAELRYGSSQIPPITLVRTVALTLGLSLDGSEVDPRTMEEVDDIVKPIVKDGEVILEVECGQTKGLLYLSKLCQGSKGSCIFSEGNWFAPNEFQFHCGRESAKDWKRSIRHFGKSLKLLLSKNILVVHQTSCECPGCKTPTQMNRTRNGKERKPVGEKTRVKKQPSLDHHVNGAFKPVGYPPSLLAPPPEANKSLPATEASSAKKQPERHCSPLRESTNTKVIDEPRSPKSSPTSDQEDRHAVTSDTENSANSPAKHEDTKAEAKSTAAAPKSEKTSEGTSHDQLRKQFSPPKAECARVKGDFRPKTQHEARGEKRKSSSESAEERTRDAKVAAVSSASHPDTPQRKSSDHEGRRSASPSRRSPRDSEARGSGSEEAKARREREERRERERLWERAALASHDARDTSPPSAPQALPDSYSHILSHMARSNGVPSFLSPGLMDAYALRSQDLAAQHSMISPYMPMPGITPYQSLLTPKDYPSLPHALPPTLPLPYSMNSMLAAGSVTYDPRVSLAMSNYALMDHYGRLGSLPSSVGSYFASGSHHAALLKRLHPDAPDALDLSTKAVRLDYGGTEYRYDPATLSAMYSGLHPYDYKYASLGMPKAYPEDMARGSSP